VQFRALADDLFEISIGANLVLKVELFLGEFISEF